MTALQIPTLALGAPASAQHPSCQAVNANNNSSATQYVDAIAEATRGKNQPNRTTTSHMTPIRISTAGPSTITAARYRALPGLYLAGEHRPPTRLNSAAAPSRSTAALALSAWSCYP